ncbi:sensor histidine kinase [Streptomyces griseus]|uniref:Oxygen sensor histidine kinase NreB n=1 Tax=Streptomyces stephensoniae TaxID=3375367 RepID=A0ABU2W3R4_9ACTN|nr:sensor histidine kinase [Streptomyces griseus]MDT0491934.1 sensor histidine kinase [Streptomyces griseus]
MSADVPLEEPARRLTGADGARDSDVWVRSLRPWDGYFAVVWVVTLAVVLEAAQPSWPVRATAAAIVALNLPWYVLVGRPAVLDDTKAEGPARCYVVGAMLLFLPTAMLVGETQLVTFALAPQCFMLLRLRDALWVLGIMGAVPFAGWALLWRPTVGEAGFRFLLAVATFAFSAFLGQWTMRIIAQSRDRAALIAELEAGREEIARLSTAHGALAERERMSREIHDTLAQGFTSLLMLSQAVESELDHDLPQARRHVALMTRTARENLAEARALVADGSPADLAGTSLPDALCRLADRHTAQTGAPAPLTVTGVVRPLPTAYEVVALRSCQEALANTRKHAGPSVPVSVVLEYAPDALTLSVRDEGCGFDPRARREGYGLDGVRARAEEAGGGAAVRSAPGAGTSVTVTLPLPLPSAAPAPDASRRSTR